MSIIIGLLSNIIALYVADYLVAGFSVVGGLRGYAIAGIVLGILNLLVKPILKLISFPLIIITLGLFLLVINAILLWLAAQLTDSIVIQTTIALIWATIIVALVNYLFHSFS